MRQSKKKFRKRFKHIFILEFKQKIASLHRITADYIRFNALIVAWAHFESYETCQYLLSGFYEQKEGYEFNVP